MSADSENLITDEVEVTDDLLRKAIETLQKAGPDRVKAMVGDENENNVEDENEDGDEKKGDDEDKNDDGKNDDDETAAATMLNEMGLKDAKCEQCGSDMEKGACKKGCVSKCAKCGGAMEKGVCKKGCGAAPARKSITEYMDEGLVEVLNTDEVLSNIFSAFEKQRKDDFETLHKALTGRLDAMQEGFESLQKSLKSSDAPLPLRGEVVPLEKGIGGAPPVAPAVSKAEVEAVTIKAMQKGLITGAEGVTIDGAVGTANWPQVAARFESIKAQVS